MDLLDCIGPTKSSERYNPNYGVFRLAFLYGPAWFIICFLAVVMAIIYVSVLKQEKKLDKYMTNLSQKKRNNSRKIRNQAFLYVGCMVRVDCDTCYIPYSVCFFFAIMWPSGRPASHLECPSFICPALGLLA